MRKSIKKESFTKHSYLHECYYCTCFTWSCGYFQLWLLIDPLFSVEKIVVTFCYTRKVLSVFYYSIK